MYVSEPNKNLSVSGLRSFGFFFTTLSTSELCISPSKPPAKVLATVQGDSHSLGHGACKHVSQGISLSIWIL